MTVLNGTTDFSTANWASGGTSRVDETYYETENYTDHVTKMEGVFVSPETGTFRFYLKARSSSKMTLSDPANATELVTSLHAPFLHAKHCYEFTIYLSRFCDRAQEVLRALVPGYIMHMLQSLHVKVDQRMFDFAQVSVTSNSWRRNGAESGAVSLVKDKA